MVRKIERLINFNKKYYTWIYYNAFTDDDVAYSLIQQWITPDLTDLLADLVDHVSVEFGRTESSLGGRFGRFRDE